MSRVELKNVDKIFGTTQVVYGANVSIENGTFVSFLGPSGCGKTTLLRMIAGLESVSGGEIYFGEQLVSSQRVSLKPEKRRVGMVFQNYAVWPHLSVFGNVAFPLRVCPHFRELGGKLKASEINERVMKALEAVKLAHLKDRMPSELSGGQLQRIAVGRAIVAEPKILLLDEPFSNLDVTLRVELREEVKRIQSLLKITTILVTHDQEEALSLSDRVVVMNAGRVCDIGTPQFIFSESPNTFVSEFVGQAQKVMVGGSEKWVRPHQISIDASGETASLGSATLEGVVSRVAFMGNQSQIVVTLPTGHLKAFVPLQAGEAFQCGQKVMVSLRV